MVAVPFWENTVPRRTRILGVDLTFLEQVWGRRSILSWSKSYTLLSKGLLVRDFALSPCLTPPLPWTGRQSHLSAPPPPKSHFKAHLLRDGFDTLELTWIWLYSLFALPVPSSFAFVVSFAEFWIVTACALKSGPALCSVFCQVPSTPMLASLIQTLLMKFKSH